VIYITIIVFSWGGKSLDIEDMFKEKRQFVRYPVKSRCWCESKSVTMYVEALNVGKGGAFIKTYSPLFVGELVKVKWKSMISGREYILLSEVIWRREFSSNMNLPPGMGLKFLNVFDELEKEIIIPD